MSTTLLEQIVEAKIVAAVKTATGLDAVTGFWQSVAEGEVALSDSETDDACKIFVACNPRTFEDFDTHTCKFEVTFNISAPVSSDPTKARIVELFAGVQNLLTTWQQDAAVARTALSTTNVFQADAVRITGGSCGYTASTSARVATQSIEVNGTF